MMSGIGIAVQAENGRGKPIIPPYVTAWSEEQDEPETLVQRFGGIAYQDETVVDRDSHGVLWFRTPFRQGQGRPEFGRIHPLRQRRAMLRLLCQVCAGPADRTGDGVLWLLQDHREDWQGWPEGMAVTEPPVCLPCVRTSVRVCPALRRGTAVVRARRFRVAGVHGIQYRSGRTRPVAVGAATVAFDDPAISWVRAVSVVRELRGCTFTDVAT